MSKPYIAIPARDFGWLAAALHARTQLGELYTLAAAILKDAGAQEPAQ